MCNTYKKITDQSQNIQRNKKNVSSKYVELGSHAVML